MRGSCLFACVKHPPCAHSKGPCLITDSCSVNPQCSMVLFVWPFFLPCFIGSIRLALSADPHELENAFTIEKASRVLHYQTVELGIASACNCCIMSCHAFLWTSRSTACNSCSCPIIVRGACVSMHQLMQTQTRVSCN